MLRRFFENLKVLSWHSKNYKYILESSKTHQSSLTLKGGSTAFSKPFFLMEKVGCTRQYESGLSLRSFAQPFPSGDKGCANRPFNSLYDPFGSPCRGQKRCSNRFAIWLADHQRSTPAAELQFFCAGWTARTYDADCSQLAGIAAYGNAGIQ